MFEQVEALVKKQPLAGKMTLAELEAELGTDPDWPKIKANRELTIGYAKSIHIMRQVRAGIVPDGWTHDATCTHCGPVKLLPGADRVMGCPWCHGGKRGKYGAV